MEQINKGRIDKLNMTLKGLNATATRVFYEYDTKGTEYYSVEISLYDTLGEQGEYLTMFFDKYPIYTEIYNEVVEHLIKTKEEYNNSGILSGREEKYLECLNRLKLIKLQEVIQYV